MEIVDIRPLPTPPPRLTLDKSYVPSQKKRKQLQESLEEDGDPIIPWQFPSYNTELFT